MLLILLIFPVFSYAIYDTHSVSDLIKHFGSHMTFTHIYNDATQGTTLSTAWTLGIEIAFYVFFPLIAKVFKKHPVLAFLGMFVIGQAARVAAVGAFDLRRTSVTSFPLLYIDNFGWGMLPAYFVVYARNKMSGIDKLKPFMTVISILSLFVVFYFIKWMSQINFRGYDTDGSNAFRMLYRFIVDGAFAAFLFSTVYSYDFWAKKVWGNKFFVFLSGISYSFYLCHQNIHIFLKAIHVPYTTADPVMNDRAAMDGFVLLSILLSLTVATVFTYLIENPINRYGVKGCADKIKEKITNNKPNR